MIFKNCPKCGLEKPPTSEYFSKDKYTKDGLQGYCKKCRNEEGRKYYQDNKKQRNKINRKNYHKKKLKEFNLTQKEFEKIYIKQNGKCSICNKEFETIPYKDHDHKTGKFRGLLCNTCNIILGFAKDNSFILINCIKYLQHK